MEVEGEVTFLRRPLHPGCFQTNLKFPEGQLPAVSWITEKTGQRMAYVGPRIKKKQPRKKVGDLWIHLSFYAGGPPTDYWPIPHTWCNKGAQPSLQLPSIPSPGEKHDYADAMPGQAPRCSGRRRRTWGAGEGCYPEPDLAFPSDGLSFCSLLQRHSATRALLRDSLPPLCLTSSERLPGSQQKIPR